MTEVKLDPQLLALKDGEFYRATVGEPEQEAPMSPEFRHHQRLLETYDGTPRLVYSQTLKTQTFLISLDVRRESIDDKFRDTAATMSLEARAIAEQIGAPFYTIGTTIDDSKQGKYIVTPTANFYVAE